MKKDELIKELRKIFPPNEEKYLNNRLIVYKQGYGYRIEYSQMFSSPKVNLDSLIALKNLFICDDINRSPISVGGCESCDYGSEYGNDIFIVNPRVILDIDWNSSNKVVIYEYSIKT